MTERRPKYGNRKCEYGGHTFDSRAEMRRYQELELALAAGEIRDLECQHAFRLVVNDVKICDYRADFIYRDAKTRQVVVEDVKGVKTPAYQLKKKLMLALFGIVIAEVEA